MWWSSDGRSARQDWEKGEQRAESGGWPAVQGELSFLRRHRRYCFGVRVARFLVRHVFVHVEGLRGKGNHSLTFRVGTMWAHLCVCTCVGQVKCVVLPQV